MDWTQLSAAAIVVVAIVGVMRGVDVRIVLFAAALAIASLVSDPMLVIRSFFSTFSNERYVVPICSAMGFAFVLRHTECDQHLVRLLMRPVAAMRLLLIPAVILVGFMVNIPVISQTSVAVCLGPVVIPLMRAAGMSNETIAACLCLGVSMGGELMNPGAPELQTIRALTNVDATILARSFIPWILFPYALVATLVFWWMNTVTDTSNPSDVPLVTPTTPLPLGRVNYVKAFIPVLPLLLLFVTGPPWFLVKIPQAELASTTDSFGSRLIGLAMLIGVVAAALSAPAAKAKDCGKQFFEGAGAGFTQVISLIVVASCFADAIKACGLAKSFGELFTDSPNALVPFAAGVPLGFAFISGSGIASTRGLFEVFYHPAVQHGYDPSAIGSLVSVGAAAGRTMSPVSAVVLMCASLTGAKPAAIIRRVGPALVAGLCVAILLRMLKLT